VGVLLLVAITVGGTLFASGFFAPDTAQDPEAAIAALEAAADEEAAAAAAAGPSKVQLDSPELLKFQQSYYQLEKELVVNIANSRKVMQASIAIMTHYDDRVVDNVEKHTFPLRNAMLTVMSQQTDASITSPDFRKNLSEELKIVMNAKLEELEDFGGIEAVYLTEFVVQ
jgi:flagellar FliL protein